MSDLVGDTFSHDEAHLHFFIKKCLVCLLSMKLMSKRLAENDIKTDDVKKRNKTF